MLICESVTSRRAITWQ